MKAGNFFGSYLQKEDVPEPTVVTIKSAASEMLNEEDKLIIYFRELDKGLVCNVTNKNAMVAICGDDETDHWIGAKVLLFVDKNVVFAGKRVGGLRLGLPSGGGGGPVTREQELDLARTVDPLLDRKPATSQTAPAGGDFFPGSDLPANALHNRYRQYIALCETDGVDVKGRGFVEPIEEIEDVELEMRINLMKKWLTPREPSPPEKTE